MAARPHMTVAADKGGNDPELLSRLGGVALILREHNAASGFFRRALALDPELAVSGWTAFGGK